MDAGGVHVDHGLTVLRVVPPPPSAIPDATHVVGVAHETDVRLETAGMKSVVQFVPS